jgi:hypothetical protein
LGWEPFLGGSAHSKSKGEYKVKTQLAAVSIISVEISIGGGEK